MGGAAAVASRVFQWQESNPPVAHEWMKALRQRVLGGIPGTGHAGHTGTAGRAEARLACATHRMAGDVRRTVMPRCLAERGGSQAGQRCCLWRRSRWSAAGCRAWLARHSTTARRHIYRQWPPFLHSEQAENCLPRAAERYVSTGPGTSSLKIGYSRCWGPAVVAQAGVSATKCVWHTGETCGGHSSRNSHRCQEREKRRHSH